MYSAEAAPTMGSAYGLDPEVFRQNFPFRKSGLSLFAMYSAGALYFVLPKPAQIARISTLRPSDRRDSPIFLSFQT